MLNKQLLVVHTNASAESRIVNWQTTTANTADRAVEKMQSISFDLIAVESGFTAQEKGMIAKIASIQQPEVVVFFYDDVAEVEAKALEIEREQKAQLRHSFSITDNAFENHPLYVNTTIFNDGFKKE